MDIVWKEEGIYHLILNDRVITQEILKERVRLLHTHLSRDNPAYILLIIIAEHAEYDSEETHYSLSSIFDEELADFHGIPRRTAMFNHYRNDSKYGNVRFFTDREEAV